MWAGYDQQRFPMFLNRAVFVPCKKKVKGTPKN